MLIPAINAQTFEEICEKVRKVEKETEWIHIDVTDGVFTPNTLWNTPKELQNLKTNVKIEVHLMIQHPENVVDQWIESGAHRLIIHVESTEQTREIIQKCRQAGVEIAIALNPETPAEAADAYAHEIAFVQTLGVPPGKSGQKMDKLLIYEKIRALRRTFPDLPIEIDGGVTLETAQKAKEAGATIFAAASAIFGAEDPIQAMVQLKKVCG